MKRIGAWLIGAIFSLIAILGLALAAAAHNGSFEWFGFVMMAFGILMLVRLINMTIPAGTEDA